MTGSRFCHRVQFAQRTVIQLAVQTMRRMSRKYLQLFRFGIALPFVRLQPHWMPRAIRISVIGNTLRKISILPLAVLMDAPADRGENRRSRINRSLSGFSGISINWLACQNSANGGNSTCWLARAAGQRYKTFPAIAAHFSFRKTCITALLPTFTQVGKTSKSLRAS